MGHMIGVQCVEKPKSIEVCVVAKRALTGYVHLRKKRHYFRRAFVQRSCLGVYERATDFMTLP